jgi:hypothetical protein
MLIEILERERERERESEGLIGFLGLYEKVKKMMSVIIYSDKVL